MARIRSNGSGERESGLKDGCDHGDDSDNEVNWTSDDGDVSSKVVVVVVNWIELEDDKGNLVGAQRSFSAWGQEEYGGESEIRWAEKGMASAALFPTTCTP